MNPNSCVICGGSAKQVRESEQIAIGNRKATVEVERQRCEACDEVFYSKQQALAAQRAAAAKLREQEGLLTPDEIKQIRVGRGLTQSDLERLLAVGPKTVVRWERGTVFQNSSTDQLLRVIRDVPQAFDYLKALRGVAVATDGEQPNPLVGVPRVVAINEWKDSQRARIKPSETDGTPLPEIPKEALK